MIVIDELKEAVNIMFSPGTATQKERSIRAAIAFYYKVLVVPLILYILALAIPETTISPYMLYSLLYIILALAIPETTISLVILSPLFTVISLIVYPLVLLVVAGLYHLVGKLIKVFNNPYSNTFTATVYSTVPYVLLVWLLAFTNNANPMLLVGIDIIFFVVAIWEIIITIIAFTNQQKTSRLRAFAVWLVVTLVLVLGSLYRLGVFSSATFLGTSCIAASGFYCTNPTLSTTGVLTVTIGQATGQPWTTPFEKKVFQNSTRYFMLGSRHLHIITISK